MVDEHRLPVRFAQPELGTRAVPDRRQRRQARVGDRLRWQVAQVRAGTDRGAQHRLVPGGDLPVLHRVQRDPGRFTDR